MFCLLYCVLSILCIIKKKQKNYLSVITISIQIQANKPSFQKKKKQSIRKMQESVWVGICCLRDQWDNETHSGKSSLNNTSMTFMRPDFTMVESCLCDYHFFHHFNHCKIKSWTTPYNFWPFVVTPPLCQHSGLSLCVYMHI